MRVKQDDIVLDSNLSSLEINLSKLYRSNIIQPLKGFCRVIEEGSLSNAAEKYGVTPGLLTKQIKVIELQLGIELFNRDNNCRIFPNEAGLRFYEEVSGIINDLENVILEFSKEIKDEESSTLRIATTSALLSVFTPIIKTFEEKNKKITIELCVLKQEEFEKRLLDNKIDAFISSKETAELVNPKMNFIKLSEYNPYLVLYKGHELENKDSHLITIQDLIKQNMCFNKNGITMTSLKSFIDNNKIKSVVGIEDSGLETIKSLIKNKIGIWIVFDIFLNEFDSTYLSFKKISHLFPGGDCGIFVSKIHKPALDTLINFLLKNNAINLDFLKNVK